MRTKVNIEKVIKTLDGIKLDAPVDCSILQQILADQGVHERTFRRILTKFSDEGVIKLKKIGRGTGKGVGNVITKIDHERLRWYATDSELDEPA